MLVVTQKDSLLVTKRSFETGRFLSVTRTREKVFISLEALQDGRAPRSAVSASQWPDYNITSLHKEKR